MTDSRASITKRRLLVTGGAGFIGANFVRYWREQHSAEPVIVLDALTYAGNRANLDGLEGPECRFVHGSINDTELVEGLLRDEAINTIVHFAAESHVDRSIEGPDVFIEANILGTLSLLKAARKVWMLEPEADGSPALAHHFHHVSTDEVFGSLATDDPAFTERTAYAPNSPYSASKAASDHLVRAWHHTYGLAVTTSNCSNNYGPYHFPEKLVPLMILNVLHGVALPIYGDGMNVRDWLYVEDHARGIERVLDDGQLGETYNIGGCNEWANIDIVKLICATLDERFADDPALATRFPKSPAASGRSAESLMTFVSDRAGHDFRYAINANRIETELGFSPAVTFEDGVQRTIDWYLNNETWWKAVMDGSYCKT